MILVMSDDTIGAAEFKATCLAVLDEVARTGRPIVVTKRGKPVAKLVPVKKKRKRSLGSRILYIADDIISPIDVKWNVDR
jgi:prevent-host-death family protein